MRLVPVALSWLCCVVNVAVPRQCGIVGNGQGDPFGLLAQWNGNFLPPVPVAPFGQALTGPGDNPWMSFGRSGSTSGSSGAVEDAPSPADVTSAFEHILSLFQPPGERSLLRSGKILRRRRIRRDIGNATTEDNKPLHRVKRIIGGYDAAPGQLCWQVKIQIGNFFDETICGGSIIGSRTILMAAHCLYNEQTRRRVSDRRVTVVVGGANRDVGERYGMDLTGCSESYNVERSIVNSAYNYDLNDNDIAILILTRAIDLDNKPCACPICLTNRLPQKSEWCVVSGYGEESSDGKTDRNPVPLKWTQLQIRPNDYSGSCAFNSFSATALRPQLRTNVDLFLCAGTQKFEDTCQGDSGGPLVCLDPVRRTYYQAGITSFGDDCGAGVGGQYTKVSSYIPWIVATSLPGDVMPV